MSEKIICQNTYKTGKGGEIVINSSYLTNNNNHIR